jgi:hypothetical protein
MYIYTYIYSRRALKASDTSSGRYEGGGKVSGLYGLRSSPHIPPPGLLTATQKISGLYELRSSPRTIPPPDLLTAMEKTKRRRVVTHSVTPEIATAFADAPTLATTAIIASAPWQITYIYIYILIYIYIYIIYIYIYIYVHIYIVCVCAYVCVCVCV